MIGSVYASKETLRTDLSSDEIVAALDAKDGLLWIDISQEDPTALGILRDTFHFHPLAIEDCFDERISTAKADDYADYLFLVTQSASYEPGALQLGIREIGVFLGGNYVVSVHKQPIMPVQDLFRRACSGTTVLQRGPDFLAHSIFDSMVDELQPVVETMDEQLDDLQALILEDPQHDHLNAVMALKRNTLRLRRLLISQRDLMSRLSREEYPKFIRAETAIFFRDVYDHLVREESLIESVRELSDSALNYYLSATNNRMNEVMKAFSVVAAIFLPLTLIASIFGTNLDYAPIGLTFKGGFYLMLVIMLGITGAMIAYFRARHWF